MRARLKAIMKSSRFLYLLYYYVGTFGLRLLGLLVRVNPKQVMFVSYGGQKYDDSPRVVYEAMKKKGLDKLYRCVWAFNKPEEFSGINYSVKIDTLKYYIVAMQSAYWITNSSATRGLNFKKKKTKNFFFTHGMTGIKKIGNDIEKTQGTFRRNFTEVKDAIFIEGKYEIDILAHAWNYERDAYVNVGLPRNDDLVSVTTEEIVKIKHRLGIPIEKKIILYTPTFREQSRDKNKSNVLGIPFDFEKWERAFSDEYVMLITAHYEVAKLLGELPQNGFVFNAFKYPVLNDLLKVADIMISDYSSVIFDYAILERPIFCYGYDYDNYKLERGVYTDLDTLFSQGVFRNEDELIQTIKTMDFEKECQFTRKNIKEKYLTYYDGKAAERAVEMIFGGTKNAE